MNMNIDLTKIKLISFALFAFTIGVKPAFGVNPSLSPDGEALIYPNGNSIVNCDGISPEALLMAIYANHQLNSLFDQVSEKTLTLEDMKKILQNADRKVVKIIDKTPVELGLVKNIDNIPVDVDFSQWPNVDAKAFDDHAKIWPGEKVTLNERRTLSDIVSRLRSGDSHLKHAPSQEEIHHAVWETYFKFVPEFPPEQTVVDALEELKKFNPHLSDPFAIDIGCGTGRDTKLLLKEGWRVLAINSEENALTKLSEKAKEILGDKVKDKLIEQNATFSSMKLEAWPQKANLITSSYTLPYAGKEFKSTWNRIAEKLAPGGMFAGQFFGEEDDFHGKSGVVTHSTKEVYRLLKGFDILYIKEKRWDGKRIDGTNKRWHVFDVVARKKTAAKERSIHLLQN